MLPATLPIPCLLLLAVVFFLSALLLSHLKQTKDDRKLPPGPPAWPVIGNLHLLGTLPHRALQALAKRYGPIMSLQLGQVPTVVISSPEAAELVLKTYDTVFASRPKTQASQYLSYGSKGLAFSEYGPYWRSVRKLCTLQLLSASKVQMFGPIRREEVGQLVKSIEKSAAAREVVDLSEKVGEVVEDIMYRMILGRKRDDRFDVKGLVHEALSLAGAFNAAEYVPLLGPFDIQSFLLDKPSGKKCYMLYARSLSIVWACTPRYWRWTSVPQARFNEVAELLSVCWLEIRGRINTRMLSPSTLYATYLVFNLTVDANGFEDQPVEASIRIPGSGTLNRTVYLDAERGRRLQYQIVTRIMGVEARTPIPTENLDLQYPKQRADGWLEIELGNFFNEGGDDQELEMAVREIKGGHWKSGLVIQGFDIRPKLNQ